MSEPSTVRICGGLRAATKINHPRRWCPRCKKRRRMLEWFEEYYGWTRLCKAVYYGRNGHRYVCPMAWGD